LDSSFDPGLSSASADVRAPGSPRDSHEGGRPSWAPGRFDFFQRGGSAQVLEKAQNGQGIPRKLGLFPWMGCKLSTVGRTRFLRTIVASKLNIHVKAFPPGRAPSTIHYTALQAQRSTIQEHCKISILATITYKTPRLNIKCGGRFSRPRGGVPRAAPARRSHRLAARRGPPACASAWANEALQAILGMRER
jgi:hypothetical protein